MKRCICIIEAITDLVSGKVTAWLFFVLMSLVVIEVTGRYVFNRPLLIADEIGCYLIVATTFMGLAYTFKEKGHVRIDFIVDRLPAKIRNWLRVITLTIATAFVPLLLMGIYRLVEYSHNFGVRSGSVHRFPLQWPQMVMFIGALLLLFQFIPELVRAIGAVRTLEREP